MTHTNLTSLILRVGFGGMMLTHGWGKFNSLMSGDFSFADPVGIGETPTLILAVLAEFIFPILLILGYKTRISAVLPALTMIVAAFIVHADDPWNNKEFPLLYFLGFSAIYLLGSGEYSLDWKLKKI
ncbi:DoxX family protein [Ekhidna sp.]|uniref:DoxX family protein n=1 Tax=Ekhidna sp. TaxID=2608089 RepID=UPI0032974A4B